MIERNLAGDEWIFVRGIVAQHGFRERYTWSSRKFRARNNFIREERLFPDKKQDQHIILINIYIYILIYIPNWVVVNGQWVALGSHPSLGLSLLPQNLDVAIVSWCFMTSSSASKARQRRRTIPKGPMTAEIVFRRQRIVIFGKLGIIMCVYIYMTYNTFFVWTCWNLLWN